MLPPLFFSVRVPTILIRFWRSFFSEKPRAGLPHRGPLSIIIFRLDALGDVVMTTPLFRELKRAFHKSHCTVVVQHALKPLLVTNPRIDEILTPPQAGSGHLPRRVNELLAAWLLYWRHLRGRQFDIAISPRWDLDEHLATLLCLLTNATRRVGYTEKASPLKQRLNRGFDAAFTICLSAGPVRHEVVRNLMVLEAFGGTLADSRLEIWLTGRDRGFAARLLASVPGATSVIALGIGATTTGRCWPLQRYAECISRLAATEPSATSDRVLIRGTRTGDAPRKVAGLRRHSALWGAAARGLRRA
jgi:ADP-heptose:LPS heptosyltransferase